MSDNREERAPMLSQAMDNVRQSGALSHRPGARRHRWTVAAPGSASESAPGTGSPASGESGDAGADPDSGESAGPGEPGDAGGSGNGAEPGA